MVQSKTKKIKRSGGHRIGAGRPSGTGKFREKTRPLRIPESLIPKVSELLDYFVEGAQPSHPDHQALPTQVLIQDYNVPSFVGYLPSDNPPVNQFPLYSNRVSAGFPSPADDHIEAKLDLNQYLVKHPSATFFVRVEGDSMINAGIHENDLLIVDRSLKPTHGKIIIAVINGELTVKRLSFDKNQILLLPENERYPNIRIDDTMEFNIWGVVTNVIHMV